MKTQIKTACASICNKKPESLAHLQITLEQNISLLKPEDLECLMCLDLLEDVVVTTCGHVFCRSCLVGWLSKGCGRCPICRADLPGLG